MTEAVRQGGDGDSDMGAVPAPCRTVTGLLAGVAEEGSTRLHAPIERLQTGQTDRVIVTSKETK